MAGPPSPAELKAIAVSTQVHILVSFWFELLVYGISIPVFLAMAYILVTKKTKSRVPSLVFGITNTAILIINTLHVAFNLYRLVNGYGYLKGPDGTPSSYIQNSSRWDSWGATVLFAFQPWFASALFIYRLFLIWDKNYLAIIFPTLLWLWNTGFSAMLLHWFRHSFTTYAKILPWLNASYPMRLVQNFVVTSLIVFKMVKQHREQVAAGVKTSSGFTLFNRIFWDSAALYTIESLIIVPLYFENQNGQFVLQTGMLAGLSIIASIMAIRVHLAGTTTTILSDTTDQVPIWIHDDEKGSLHSTEKDASHV